MYHWYISGHYPPNIHHPKSHEQLHECKPENLHVRIKMVYNDDMRKTKYVNKIGWVFTNSKCKYCYNYYYYNCLHSAITTTNCQIHLFNFFSFVLMTKQGGADKVNVFITFDSSCFLVYTCRLSIKSYYPLWLLYTMLENMSKVAVCLLLVIAYCYEVTNYINK